jgi:pimeloyl-ACP methyl ester carboxylesterase
MNRLALSSLTALAVASSGVWVACSSNGTVATGTDAGATKDAGTTEAGFDANVPSDGGVQLALACTDSIASVYGDPGAGFASLAAGTIIHCAYDRDISLAELTTLEQNNLPGDDPPALNEGYQGKPFTSGVRVYRISYRTERGDPANSPGYSSAEVLIPDTPRAADLPIIVASHGSRGQAGVCTASEENDAGSAVNPDYDALGLPLAGLGYVVILPDLAGYANFGAPGNPPSAYGEAQDVGKSTLDGARALIQLVSQGASKKVVMVGHSQGGQTEYAAVAIAATYAPDLQLVAAAAFSPLWVSQLSWGALLFEPSTYPVAEYGGTNAVSVWYHYTHSILLDGPDAGLEVFAPAAGPQIQKFVNNDCWDSWGDLEEAGANASDFFAPSFVSSVAKPAATNAVCPSGDTTCSTWIARYEADRPHISSTIPFLIWYGGDDDTIPPGRMACVIQRLGPPTADYPGGDNVNLTFCLDPSWGHSGILRAHASDVADWIGAQVLGEPAPAPCKYNQSNLLLDSEGGLSPGDDGGYLIPCETPPSNN